MLQNHLLYIFQIEHLEHSIEGLEKHINLKELNLSCNKIKKIQGFGHSFEFKSIIS